MIPLDWLRRHPEEMAEVIRKRGLSLPFDQFLHLDKATCHLQKELDQLRQKKNELKKEHNLRSPKVRLDYHHLRRQIRQKEKEYKRLREERQRLLERLPNRFLDESEWAPREQSEVVYTSEGAGEPRPGKSYLALMKELQWGGLKEGEKMAPPLFPLFRAEGARWMRRLIHFFLDWHTERGYVEIRPPLLVKQEVAYESGHLPRFDNLMYTSERKQYFWLPTAELALLALHRREILSYKILPLRYVAHTPCFRREPGVRPDGLVRLRQFDKVELFQFTTPDHSLAGFQEMVEDVTRLMERLELPFRIKRLGWRELPFQAAAACDVEVWCPISQRYLEVSTISLCLDFQARRAKVRYRKPNGQSEYVHTLNGSGLALPRLWIALLENHPPTEVPTFWSSLLIL